jgi:predicted amidophosphoribosyltransferase
LPFAGQIHEEFECSNCQGITWYFETARSAVQAKGVVLDIIHRYKYKRQLWFEPFLANLLISSACVSRSTSLVQDLTCSAANSCGSFSNTSESEPLSLPEEPPPTQLTPALWDLLVPVPLHPVKQREREFNQAERLARRLSKASCIPLNNNILRRIQPTLTQTRLSREERAENVRGAFALAGSPDLKGQRIVLIDDVMTTGATTNACARVLRRAGASQVCVWTVARGT